MTKRYQQERGFTVGPAGVTLGGATYKEPTKPAKPVAEMTPEEWCGHKEEIGVYTNTGPAPAQNEFAEKAAEAEKVREEERAALIEASRGKAEINDDTVTYGGDQRSDPERPDKSFDQMSQSEWSEYKKKNFIR